MDQVHAQLNKLCSQIPSQGELLDLANSLKQQAEVNYHQYVVPQLEHLRNTSVEDVISEFKELKVSSVTVSITLITLSTFFVFGKLLLGSGDDKKDKKSKKKGKPKKKLSKAQKANREIQGILDFVESEYVPAIDTYLDTYKTLKPEEVEAKYNYFEEMLLKELMKLDAVDVSGNEILRENRKKVIKFIQDHHKRLDNFKKEANF
ncbi:uncharacterized protein SPAPADRAFT_61426 [Spathaspora passalidarum NRRL Y-27907]|uniref:BAG domain-containing protein n=1 Tax=Spathaspora passalidarum (strain NRRL Y-27907 / 11-Y1) TaxID=619300 RepID=G3AQ26_SPAPN|nr:uncharacterized protein SPAPADRAFT_61426 [Spathaspora passalidarum NRRL Y-27907]EGW32347.1 hypothetical protein SPAPADRAFT_61426 [Spathaspora passalidarum NRRL Y-27907]